MPFVLPVFNLSVKINRASSGTAGPGDVVTVGNLAWGRRVNAAQPFASTTGFAAGTSPVLLLPPHTDIRDPFTASGADYVEVPSGSGRWYRVYYVDDIGKGFGNEHRAAMLVKQTIWPAPIP
jgi:hypothetical protein